MLTSDPGAPEKPPCFAALATRRGSSSWGGFARRARFGSRVSAKEAGVTGQAIAKHLTALSAAGWQKTVKSGREQIWELETRRLEIARRCLDRISDQWDVALDRLKTMVEE